MNKHTVSPVRTLLEVASLAEAATLAVLFFIAVPLKHLAGLPVATRVIGPVHGAAFLLYAWALVQAVSAGGWRAGEVVRMALVALLPLAGFLNQRWLKRKLRELAV